MSQTVDTGTPANFQATLEKNTKAYDAFQAFLETLDSPAMLTGSSFIVARIYPPGDEKLISVNLLNQQGAQPGPDNTVDTQNAGNVGSGGYNPANDSPA